MPGQWSVVSIRKGKAVVTLAKRSIFGLLGSFAEIWRLKRCIRNSLPVDLLNAPVLRPILILASLRPLCDSEIACRQGVCLLKEGLRLLTASDDKWSAQPSAAVTHDAWGQIRAATIGHGENLEPPSQASAVVDTFRAHSVLSFLALWCCMVRPTDV